MSDSINSESIIDYQPDIEPFIIWLSSICNPLLDVNRDYLYKIFHDNHNQVLLTQYATEAKFKSLIVSKSGVGEINIINF